jgi:lysophospholipase L1-like esterase
MALAACSGSSKAPGADASLDHAAPDAGHDSHVGDSGASDAPSPHDVTTTDETGVKRDATGTDASDAHASMDAPAHHDGVAADSAHETGAADAELDAHADSSKTGHDAHTADAGVDAGPPALRFVGRTLTDGTDPDGNGNCTPAAPCYEWSGTEVLARFTGATAFHLMMSDYGSYFDVYVDGVLQASPIVGSAGQSDYAIATGLTASATHEVSLYKRTEASSNGRTQILGYKFPNGGTLLPPPPPQSRRIEVIGDSITCGYGVLGTNGGCTPDSANEDHDDTYEAITARALDADLYTTASSGRGMYVNIDGSMTDTLPNIYGLALPYGNGPNGLWTSAWSYSAWVPDVVVINLSTNDFLFAGDPGQPFVTAYVAFVKRLRQYYPSAWIFCANGPMLTGTQRTTAGTYIQSVVTTLNDPKIAYFAFDEQSQNAANQGCDGHPNVATDQAMATTLTSTISAALGW